MIENDIGNYQDIVAGMKEISNYIDGWSGMLKDHLSKKNPLSEMEIQLMHQGMVITKDKVDSCARIAKHLGNASEAMQKNLLILNSRLLQLESDLREKNERIDVLTKDVQMLKGDNETLKEDNKMLKEDIQKLQYNCSSHEQKPKLCELATLSINIILSPIMNHKGTKLDNIQKFSAYISNKTVPEAERENVKKLAYISCSNVCKVEEASGEAYFRFLWTFRDDRNTFQHPNIYKDTCKAAIESLYQPVEFGFNVFKSCLSIVPIDESEPTL